VKSDWLVALVAGIVGFALVSWLLSVIRQQRAPPVAIQSPAAERARLSLATLGAQWHRLPGVAPAATPAEIESAYHARLAECDRVRFGAETSDAHREEARRRRAQVEDAYEFIRALPR